jgi:phosphoglycolate phosphatase-like HAD superfamily hydrolase
MRQHAARCYVGDTESDLAASIAAQLPIYLVSSGQRSREFLDQRAAQKGTRPSFENFAEALNKVKDELLS